MRVLKRSEELKEALSKFKKKGKSIGFVPTMGYLHEGHLALVRAAKKENRLVAVSIFVNPLQFGPREDFWRYPRDLGRDTELLRREKTDLLFVPQVREFYRPGFQTSVSVKDLSRPLCGITRPTHFAGVATVVLKLINLVGPDRVYLGQKDFQQCRVIEQMIEDLDVPVELRQVPTVREADGLAMSSRNVFLSAPERAQAPMLYRALLKAAEFIKAGQHDAARIKRAMGEVLKLAPRARLDYLEIVDARTLVPVVKLQNGSKILIAIAAYFSKTRLIDNLLITG